ncbi:MAG: hypothetical protein ACK448_10895 [Bacteroidota bacterium]|jgi:hypothetical protein
MLQRFNSGLMVGISAIYPLVMSAQSTVTVSSKIPGSSLTGKNLTAFAITEDKHATVDRKFVLQEINGELPVVVCSAKPEVAASINNYLYESLVADELDGVYGDEEPNGDEEFAAPALDISTDSDSASMASTNLRIYGELDFYGVANSQSLVGLTVFYETNSGLGISKNPLYTERNHYIFDANSGAAVSFDVLARLLNFTSDGLQERISSAYSFAVEEALKQPCLIENTDMAGLLKLNQQLRKSDFQADEFVRSVPVYLKNELLVFDRPLLPDAYKACDPMGVVIPLK